jgi:hypothetical protein
MDMIIPDNWQEYAVIDHGTGDSAYVHFSLTDAQVLIFDVSGYDQIATRPNRDNTLTAWKNGEQVRIEPMRRKQ